MPDQARKTESELDSELKTVLPQVLQLLLTALATALANIAAERTYPLPRLADAAAWTVAAAPALGLTQQEILEALSTPPDPLVQRIAALMQNLDTWQGSATQLAIDLNLDIDPSQLSRQLFEKQNQQALHSVGLTLTRHPGRLTRSIDITRLDKNLKNAVTPPPSPEAATTPSREAAPNPVPNPQSPVPAVPDPCVSHRSPIPVPSPRTPALPPGPRFGSASPPAR